MTLRTITFDDEQWQVVPKNPVPAMIESGANEVIAPLPTAGAKAGAVYIAMLAAAPEPPAQEPGTAAEIEALRAENERLRSAIRWALGYNEGDPQFGEQENQNRYGWRTELRRRAAMEATNAG